MDAVVYEDSPLATYLEGQALPFETAPEPSSPHIPFAPQGLPHIKSRLQSLRNNAITSSPASSEQILDQFRYIIVASQLLSDDVAPRLPERPKLSTEQDPTFVYGAILTSLASFLTAWAVHWLRNRGNVLRTSTWLQISVYIILCVTLVTGAVLASRHQYSKYIQRRAAQSLSKLVNDSQSLDGTASTALRFVQEVELVARGYDIVSPLPPVTRMEDRQTLRRCRNLRSALSNSLAILTALYVESHNIMERYVNAIDVQRYHDIYEISLVEYNDAVRLVNETSEDGNESLKDLRFALRLNSVARKVFLCDLLALKATSGWSKVKQWTSVFRVLQELEEETNSRLQQLAIVLQQEERGPELQRSTSRSLSTTSMHESPINTDIRGVKPQLRRFDDLANSIRALNARVHVLKEEIAGLQSSGADDSVITSAIAKYYDSLGTDIRSLQADWDRGRNTMLLQPDYSLRNSRSSSGPRSPISPSPSVGGSLQVVDGGPADALRLLTGDDLYRSARSSDATTLLNFDEEVFEAVSKPRGKRMSLCSTGMTREEKIAKLQEDRRKRATMHEQAENTTNMLRELQMVIKHRPHARTPSTPVQTNRIDPL